MTRSNWYAAPPDVARYARSAICFMRKGITSTTVSKILLAINLGGSESCDRLLKGANAHFCFGTVEVESDGAALDTQDYANVPSALTRGYPLQALKLSSG